jgi:hypothetical protein
MSTLDVAAAAAAGKNMVITHEPTYYSGSDDTTDYCKRTLSSKIKFIMDTVSRVAFP